MSEGSRRELRCNQEAHGRCTLQSHSGIAFSFPPPAIPGVGTSGGFSFVLEDRSGGTTEFLAENEQAFIAAANKRPELAGVMTTALLSVPQVGVTVDNAKMLTQQVGLGDVYQTLQTFMGGALVNYFTRFGRQWQVYVQAEGSLPHITQQPGKVLRHQRQQPAGSAEHTTAVDSAGWPGVCNPI